MRRILLDLDAVLDTRIALVAQLYPGAAAKLIDGKYGFRLTDELSTFAPEIDDAVFAAAYAARTADLVVDARPTAITPHLNRTIAAMALAHAEGAPTAARVHLDLNVWPYEFTDEVSLAIGRAIMARTGTEVTVDIVNIPPERITIEAILAEQWRVLYIYDWRGWYTKAISTSSMPKQKLNDVQFIFPQLAPSLRELRDMVNTKDPEIKNRDPFNTYVQVMEAILAAKTAFISPEFFSLLT